MKLQVGEQRDLNFNLELAGQKQLVVITSELPMIETTNQKNELALSRQLGEEAKRSVMLRSA